MALVYPTERSKRGNGSLEIESVHREERGWRSIIRCLDRLRRLATPCARHWLTVRSWVVYLISLEKRDPLLVCSDSVYMSLASAVCHGGTSLARTFAAARQ